MIDFVIIIHYFKFAGHSGTLYIVNYQYVTVIMASQMFFACIKLRHTFVNQKTIENLYLL